MTTIGEWNQQDLAAHNVSGLEIPSTAVKLFDEVWLEMRDRLEALFLSKTPPNVRDSI